MTITKLTRDEAIQQLAYYMKKFKLSSDEIGKIWGIVYNEDLEITD